MAAPPQPSRIHIENWVSQRTLWHWPQVRAVAPEGGIALVSQASSIPSAIHTTLAKFAVATAIPPTCAGTVLALTVLPHCLAAGAWNVESEPGSRAAAAL